MGDPCRNICSVWRPIWLDVSDAWSKQAWLFVLHWPGNYMKKFNETEGTCSFYGTVHMRTQTVLARTIQVTDAKMMNGPCVCSLNVFVVAYSILAVVLRCLHLESAECNFSAGDLFGCYNVF